MGGRKKRRSKSALIIILLIICIAAAVVYLKVNDLWIFGKAETIEETEEMPVNDSDAEKDLPEAEIILPAEEALILEEPGILLSFTGDVILGKHENADYGTSLMGKYDEVQDYSYFFKNFYDIFTEDDATIVDFEGTLTEADTIQEKEFNFKGPAHYVNILTAGGVDAATMANNHSHDYLEQGFADTENTLEEAGIKTFGYDKAAFLDIKGVSIALIGSYQLYETYDEEQQLMNMIAAVREQGADVVIVFAHWGKEMEYVPDNWQVMIGREAIDAGADFVIGCHPHVLQGYEEYNGSYIVYSMGNFCFGGNTRPADMDCYAVQWKFSFEEGSIKNNELIIIPASVSSNTDINDYQPRILTGDEEQRVLDKIESSSNSILNGYPR